MGKLLGLRWTGGALSGNGHLELTGYTGSELAASAKGTLHFECGQGSIANAKAPAAAGPAEPPPIPAALAHFDRWTADASIADGALDLGVNQVISGSSKRSVSAAIAFGDPPKISFPAQKETQAEKHK